MNAHTSITVADTALPIVEMAGVRVVTFAMVDRVHQRPDGTAKRNFNEHRHRFLDGEDFHEITQPDEIRSLGISRPQGGTPGKIVVLTETGYLMLVKSFTDDLAWTVQRQLVKAYFRTTDAGVPIVPRDYPSALRALADAAEKSASEIAQRDEAIAILEPRSDALARIADAEGTLCMTDAAKALQMRRKDLVAELVGRDWIYRRAGNEHWCAHATKLKTGHLWHKIATGFKPDGHEWVDQQVRITSKGLAKLAILLGKTTQ